MSKKFIIGMTGLGIGLALTAGVGGYFISDAVNSRKTSAVDQSGGDLSQIDIVEYNLPEELYFNSYKIYDLSDNVAIFSSSVGSYVLNKETKSFKFFSSSDVYSYSEDVDGLVYLYMRSGGGIFIVDTKLGHFETFDFNFGVNFESLTFIGNYENTLLMKIRTSGSNSKYYFVIYNTKSNSSDLVETTVSIFNSVERCFDLGDYFYFTAVYSSSQSSSSYSSVIVNKGTKEDVTISNYYLVGENTFKVKGDKMYAVLRKTSSSILCTVDLATGAVSELKCNESSVNGSQYTEFFDYENGMILSYQYEPEVLKRVASTSSGSNSIYYIAFEDDSVVRVGYEENSNLNCRTYLINGQLFFIPQNSTFNNCGSIAKFNESTKKIEIIYTSTYTGTSTSYLKIYTFNGKYLVSVDDEHFAQMVYEDNGDVSFKNINLELDLTYFTNYYEVGEDRYIFVTDQIQYYDFGTNTYKSLISTSVEIKDFSIDENVVTIYANNNVKYEFNLETLVFKAVTYWE